MGATFFIFSSRSSLKVFQLAFLKLYLFLNVMVCVLITNVNLHIMGRCWVLGIGLLISFTYWVVHFHRLQICYLSYNLFSISHYWKMVIAYDHELGSFYFSLPRLLIRSHYYLSQCILNFDYSNWNLRLLFLLHDYWSSLAE